MNLSLPSNLASRRGEAGFVVTLELLLVLTILILGSIVGLIALRNGLFRVAEARFNATLFVKDSATDTKRIKPFGFDQCEGPRILCKDPETGLSAVLSVRRNRLASRDRVYYTGASCTGVPYLAPPNDPVLPVGYFNALQNRSYGVGAPGDWDWNGVDPPGGALAGMCDNPLTELGSSNGIDCRVLLYRSTDAAVIATVEVMSAWVSFSNSCNEPVVPSEICVNFIAADDDDNPVTPDVFPMLDLVTAEQVPDDDDAGTAFANLLSVFEHDDFFVMPRIDDDVRYTEAPAAGESAPIQTRDSNEGFTTDPDDGPVTFSDPSPEPPGPPRRSDATAASLLMGAPRSSSDLWAGRFRSVSPASSQSGYVVSLTVVLLLTILVIGVVVGVVALRNGIWERNETNLIKDSSMTPLVVGQPVSFDRCETPQVLCPDPDNGLWALVGVRPDRFTSLDRVYYTGPNCTGTPYLAIPGMPPFGNPFPVTPTAPFGDAEVVGSLNHLQGVSYGVGAPASWDPINFDPNGPGLLYRSTTTLLTAPMTIASMWDSKALGPCYGGLREDNGMGGVQVGGILEAGTVSGVAGSAVTVTLAQAYIDPVVVTTIYNANNVIPPVTRVSVPNVPPVTSFTVRLQIPSGQAPAAETVSYLVVESGSWQVNGLKLEAQKYLSTVTDENNSWVGQIQSYLNSYLSPAVIGQVMSENDPRWSVFWSRGQNRNQPPNATRLYTGKHVGEDTVVPRADEIVGFVVLETAHGDLGPSTSPTPIEYEAALGPDTVRSSLDAPPYTYTFATAFGSTPSVVLLSQAAMDGPDGSWGQIDNGAAISSTGFNLTVEEDQITGVDIHTTEQVAYVAFAQPFALERQLCNNLGTPTFEPLLLAEEVVNDDGDNVLEVYTTPFKITAPILTFTPADTEGAALRTATSPGGTTTTQEIEVFAPAGAEDGALPDTSIPPGTEGLGDPVSFPGPTPEPPAAPTPPPPPF